MTKKQHGLLFHIGDVVLNIILIVAVVVAIRTFLVSPFQVDGNSMADTLEDGQYIIINKLAYIVGKPKRGDIAVFNPPGENRKYYVKRVIGLPGDKISIRDGYIYLIKRGEEEESKLREIYLNEANDGHTYRHPPQQENKSEIVFSVPEDKYLLLGDNRKGSLDSRSFGILDKNKSYVGEDEIKGRVWFVALPLSKINVIDCPGYEFCKE
ncbi:signal peptidase I [Candidatus Peregrinibacteria bacterium]|nr:signal peptidase I [Candidatus Peregrinibacteria bacterium]